MNSALAILDTNICLDLFVFNDPDSDKLLNAIQDNAITPITRNDCREEWLRVLEYPKLSLNKTEKEQALLKFNQTIKLINPIKRDYKLLPLCSDKDDQKFMELAYDTRAQYLFTKDKALLKLARKNKNNHFKIITPRQWQCLSLD